MRAGLEVIDRSGSEFFACIRAGILAAGSAFTERGHGYVRVIVLEVMAHPLDTTADWMQKQGQMAMEDLLSTLAER